MVQHAKHDAPISGLFHFSPVDRPKIEKIAHQHGCRLQQVDLSSATSRELLLHALGAALAFPAWYGANFDALHDCLGDDTWRGKHGSIVLLGGLAQLQQTDPDSYATLLDVLASAAQAHGNAHSLSLLLDHPAPGIPPFPAA